MSNGGALISELESVETTTDVIRANSKDWRLISAFQRYCALQWRSLKFVMEGVLAPCPLPFLFFPYPSPFPFPLPSLPLNPARGSGERCKFGAILSSKYDTLVATILTRSAWQSQT